MKKLLALALAASDRVNPVAVKEFRQAVQSRWVIAVLMLFLLVNLSVMGGYLMLSPNVEASIDGGRNIFLFLLSILLITCIGFVPAYSGIRLSLERNDANIDLFFVTTITPGAIVRGKYFTAMALTLLIFSACMPFMTLTYLLRGIDLPTIFGILAFGFVICAAANALGIFAGSVSGSWLIRGLVDAGAIFWLFCTTFMTIQMSSSVLMFGRAIMFSRMSAWQFFGWWLGIEVMGIGLLYVLSVALLSPKQSNRMLVPRLYIMGSWSVSGAAMAIYSHIEKSADPITTWVVCSGMALIVLTMTALGERDTWSARVRRTIPHNRMLRLAAFLLYTGSAGGVAWCVLMFAATMVLGCVGYGVDVEVYHNMPIIFGYALCYCLTTAFLRSTVLRNVPTVNLSVVAAFLGVAVCLVPYLIVFFIGRNWWLVLPWYLLGSPMVLTMTDQAAKNAAQLVVIVWFALCMLLSAPWAISQWRQFTPYQAIAVDKTTQ